MLPNNETILGKLEYVEIYDYYDFPILFSCKNEKDEVYLGIYVDRINSGDVFLFALIEDPSTLILLERDLVPADFLLDPNMNVYKNLKIYEVVVQTSIVNEATKEDVESYFSEYVEETKEKQRLFAEMLKEIDEKLG